MSSVEQAQDPKWLVILKEEVDRSSIAAVARKLEYSRPVISLVLGEKYPGDVKKVAAKVLTTFSDSVFCPFLDGEIKNSQCQDFQSRDMPTSDPNALRHWCACRNGCPHSYHSIDEGKEHA